MLIYALFTQVREHPLFDHSENQLVGSVTDRKRSSLRTLSPFHYTSWRIGQQQSPSTSDFGQLILTQRAVVLRQQTHFSLLMKVMVLQIWNQRPLDAYLFIYFVDLSLRRVGTHSDVLKLVISCKCVIHHSQQPFPLDMTLEVKV